jgi:hypothetical protein
MPTQSSQGRIEFVGSGRADEWRGLDAPRLASAGV